MKKICVAVIAIILLAALAIPSLAEETIEKTVDEMISERVRTGMEQIQDMFGMTIEEETLLDEKHGFAPDGEYLYYTLSNYDGYGQVMLFNMDQYGYVISVKEKYYFDTKEIADAATRDVASDVEGEWVKEGQIAYFTWDISAIREAFDSMLPSELPFIILEHMPIDVDNTLTKTPFSSPVMSLGGLSVTADESRYKINQSMEIDLTLENSTDSDMRLDVVKLYVNGWLMPEFETDVQSVPAGGSIKATYRVKGADTAVFSLMGISRVNSVRISARALDADGNVLAQGVSEDIKAADAVEEKPVEGCLVKLSDSNLKLSLVEVSRDGSRAVVMVERPESAEWHHALLSPVFDGESPYSPGGMLSLEDGTRALMYLDGTGVLGRYPDRMYIDDIDMYIVYLDMMGTSTSPRVVKPQKVPLLDTGADGALLSADMEQPVQYEHDDVKIRYLGVSGDVIPGQDVILLSCENNSDILYFFEFYKHGGISFDGGAQQPAGVMGRFCFPKTRITLAAVPTGAETKDLSEFKEAKFRLNMYTLLDGYSLELHSTDTIVCDLGKRME